MNNNLDRMWKEGPREAMKNFIQDIRCSGRDSKRAPSECKSEVLPRSPTCSVISGSILSVSNLKEID
jgi:hypothetical protein